VTRPLLPVERRIWDAVQRVAPAKRSTFALLRVCVELEGPLERVALRRAMELIAGRHDAFHTRYLSVDGEPRAEDAGRVSLDLEFRDCDGEAAALAEGETWAAVGFDLERAPLHRFLLVGFAPDRHHFVHLCHHISCDLRSFRLLYDELGEAYRALRAGETPSLWPPVQYADVAERIARSLDAAARAEHEAFWRRHLQPWPLPPPFASQGAPPGVRPTPGRWAVAGWRSASPVGGSLVQLCAERGLEQPAVALAALLVWLHREGGSGVPIGYMSANRQRDTIRVVGIFATLLPLRIPLDDTLQFAALVDRVTAGLKGVLAHQALPPNDDDGAQFRVVFSYRNQDRGESILALEGTRARVFAGFTKQRTVFDLWLHIGCHRDGHLYMKTEYDADKITVEMLQAFGSRLEAILVAAIADPATPLHELARVEPGAAVTPALTP
jgi:hypothetical protein